MLKLLGSACIFGGGVLAWFYQSAGRRREWDTLSDLLTALHRMAEAIRMARTPLPALLDRLQSGLGPDTAAFFRSVARAARQGGDVPQAWRDAAAALPLAQEERDTLSQLGSFLQGDAEHVCKAAALAIGELSRSLEERRKRRPDQEKRATALCFSAAALLVILLL